MNSEVFFLPIFYIDVFGPSTAAVSELMLVCRLDDGVTGYPKGVIADVDKRCVANEAVTEIPSKLNLEPNCPNL